MNLHTVVVSYDRLRLTKQAIESYFDTVTVPHKLMVVDNCSGANVIKWLTSQEHRFPTLFLDQNYYPGYATNRGFERAAPEATHFQRADNDFEFLPGWCDVAQEAFEENLRLGQLGLRTDEEEPSTINVGGNMIVRREIWDSGIVYDERPWPKYDVGWSEDGYLSPMIARHGWQWGRVPTPCIRPLPDNYQHAYYRRSYGDRRIPQ